MDYSFEINDPVYFDKATFYGEDLQRNEILS